MLRIPTARLLVLGAGLPLLASMSRPPVWIDLDRSVAVHQTRGVDPDVDYAALALLGPWDDRNYLLTRQDLRLLPPGEARIREPLPAYFRVALRRARPALARISGSRYPLHALNVFLQTEGGDLVDGRLYERVSWRDGRFFVDLRFPAYAAGGGNDGVPGEVRVSSPEGEAESAVAIHPSDTTRIVAATVRMGTKQQMYWSADGGASWDKAELPLGGTCCDPALAWSSDGRFAYAATIGNCSVFGCELYFYRSGDGGVSWTGLEEVTPGQPRRAPAQDADRETMHVDRSSLSSWRDRIYITYHSANVLHVIRSADFGSGWSGTALSSAPEELGIGGDITTDRAGNVYLAWPAYNSRTIRIAKSTDGGATFGASSVIATTEAAYGFPLLSQESREIRLYVSIDADLSSGPYADGVYVAWCDTTAPDTDDPRLNHARIRVAASHDGGASWSVTTPHATDDALEVDRWQPALAVGRDGTVHVVFHDTRNTPDRTGVDIYYSYSTDGAQSWSAPRRVTSTTSPNIEQVFEFGDYGGLDIVLGELVAIFTDNRSESGAAGDSVDVYASGISPGPGNGGAGRIRGSRDVPGEPLRVSKNADGIRLDLSWDTVCGNGVDYEVHEGVLGDPESLEPVLCSTGGATTATIAPSPSHRFYLVVAAVSGAEGSYGRRSDGTERGTASPSCLPQVIGGCP